jgi:predicted dehydrogenase
MENKKRDDAFGWCVVGTGRIANVVANEITASGRHKIVAVYSRTREKAEAFAQKFGAKCCGSLSEALQADGVEGVYIATPHSVHYQYILQCAAHKKAALCEKAFTVNALQAREAVRQAEAVKVYLAEGMWTRFNPVVKQIQAWIKDGEIGEILSVEASFSLPLGLAKPFVSNRVYLPEYAGGALLDLGVYPIAYAHMLLGYPDSIKCKAVVKNGVDFDDEIVFEYKNGAKCTLYCSFDKYRSYKSVIIGTKGKIESPMFYKPNSATLKNGEGRKTARCKRGYIYQFDAVAEDIRANRIQNALITHRDTIEIMSIMDECRAQNNFKYPEAIESL